MAYALNALFILAAVAAMTAIGLSLRHLAMNWHQLHQATCADGAPRIEWLKNRRKDARRTGARRHPPLDRSPMNRFPRHVRHPDAA